jgi:hypothetical protein
LTSTLEEKKGWEVAADPVRRTMVILPATFALLFIVEGHGMRIRR